MNNFSILIAGKAGDGIDKSSIIIARLVNQLGYRVYIYRDYPSIIRGGHTFSIIRASSDKIASHLNKIDVLLVLNQDSLDFHRNRLNKNSIIIYDTTTVTSEGFGIPISKIVKEENAPDVTRNSCMIGAMCKAIGIEKKILEQVLRNNISKELDSNLKVALRGYDEAKEFARVEKLNQPILPILSGSEAIGLGLIKAGLKAYISYPMTPTSGILHFLAGLAEDFSIKVIHPENEIAVMLMALGFSYAGEKAAVGTSGGGFCLMTEGLSLSAMAELPVVIILGQRPGPSTGLPTYASQTELNLALSAGQGEFVRLIVAPGDAEEAYYWSAVSLNMSWKYQIPAIILSDKTLNEGVYSFDITSFEDVEAHEPMLWDRRGSYKRYQITDGGVSPFAYLPDKDAIIKVNSYEHDESGITTEDRNLAAAMQDKRLRKGKALLDELERYDSVKVYGNRNSSTAVMFWGSNKGSCVEAGTKLGLKVIQPLLLSPFPSRKVKNELKDVERIICVENNATGQLADFLKGHGIEADKRILKYDGRPFTPDELEKKI